MPSRTAWSVAIRVVVGGGSVKDAIYLRGITRILDALAEGGSLDVLFVGKLALDHIPLIQDLLDRDVLNEPWVRPRWLDMPALRSASTNYARARRSWICLTQRYRHEGCILRQRRRYRNRRVRDHAAGQSRRPGRG